ncbi:hypothetical protein [Paenibacillus sp. GCM10028914]|uniref:hypothetical protein n=1 Tax=Paenibacillus sp. GCM10028914 TaxID=3273416 RepID=UPI0036224719
MHEFSSTPWCYAVDSLNSGLMIIRPDGKIDQINNSLRLMLSEYGASPDFDWHGISFLELPPSIFGRSSFEDFFEGVYIPSLKNVIVGNNHQYTVEYSLDLFGNTIWILSEARPLVYDTENIAGGIVVSFTNITRFKQRQLRLEQALYHSCSLHGHIPICAVCKHVRTVEDWEPVESYLESRIAVEFTHDICPSCIRRLYPKYSSLFDESRTATESEE